VSWIAGADVAAVAAAALTRPGHENQAYTLTGSEALTITQVANILGEVSGRKVQHVDVPEAAARKAMLDLGMPAWMVDGMMELHAIGKAGYAAAVSDTVQKLIGRAPLSFAQFAQQNAAAWKA
jgi:uncharacterized protein YbjT (DUF2867 family)